MSLTSGTRLGAYEILSVIGAGGMGQVYRARDTRLNRDVALKVLPEIFVADPERLARFRREAQLLASLNHPNVAQIYGVEDSAAGPALVMELVDGRDLSVLSAIPLADALKIARQIAEALIAAHEAGVVHRDLKPANIKVRDDLTVKVLDFGLAKALAGDSSHAGAKDPSRSEANLATVTSPAMTQLGLILGTAAYMAPEQAKGKPVDRRADVWAFGVVVYEMLTGTRAFKGDDVSDTLASVLKDSPSFAALPTEVPPAVRRLLRRCLEKDPARRLDSMAVARMEIDDALAAPAEEAAITPTSPPGRRLRTMGIAAVSLAAGGLLVGVPVWTTMTPRPAPIAKLAITPPADEPLRLETNHPDLVITPDGSRVVYWNNVGGENRLIVRPLDRFEGRILANLGLNPRGPFVSPDGAWVAYFVGESSGTITARLVKAPIDGGAPVVIGAIDALLRGGTWASDGTIVFATARPTTGLFRVRATGGTPELLTTPDSAKGEADHLWPSILPGGRHVLFSITRGGPDSDIALLALDTKTWSVLIKGGTSPRYIPTGHIVYASGDVLRAVPFDVNRLAVTGDSRQVSEGLIVKSSGAADYSVSNNGTLAMIPGDASQSLRRMAWLDRDGKTLPLPADAKDYRLLRLSSDGRRIAAVVDVQGVSSIWIFDLVRETMFRLTPPDFPTAMSPVWSPDDAHIVFAAPRGPANESGGLFRIAASGTGVPERLTSTRIALVRPSTWSPDGKEILGSVLSGERVLDLERVTLGPPVQETPLVGGPGFQTQATLSSDGRLLAYQSDESGRSEVFIRPYPNVNADRIPVSQSGGQEPFWSRDGRQLFYCRPSDRTLLVVDVRQTGGISIGTPRKALVWPDTIVPGSIGAALDNRRFLVLAEPQDSRVSEQREIHIIVNWFEELKARMGGVK